jgi:4-amino-4-deoxy-L-arabinose transferase-like glycosyltransferase
MIHSGTEDTATNMDPVPALPRSLPACLPVLWKRVLFPGTSPAATRLRWQNLALLLLLPGVLLYPCLSFHLFEPDEGRYAEIPREMLARGEWVVPYLQGEPYLDKPPLLYWLVMGSYSVFGVHEWAARLVPALAVHGCILLVYGLGRRRLGERAALWGAVLLCLAPGFTSIGRLLVIDGLLAWWVCLSLLAGFEALRRSRLHRGWWLLSAGACGLGVLTKGPVALVLWLPPLWAQRWLARDLAPVSRRARLAFLGVVVGVALPWYAAICWRLPTFARYFLWEHNVARFLTPFDHLEPVWYYAPILLAGLLPATLLVIPCLRYLLSGDAKVAGRRCPELGFVVLAGGWCVLFFSLSGCKLPTYVLPAYPFLALALGYFVSTSGRRQLRWFKPLAGAAFLVLVVGHNVVVPWYAWYRSPGGRQEELSRYCGNPAVPVICFPRACDSAGFYLRRDDLRSYRSKEIDRLRAALREQPRTVVLCTHRHALQGLRQALPPELRLHDETHFGLGNIPGVPAWFMQQAVRLAGETPLGLCDVAVVERRSPGS